MCRRCGLDDAGDQREPVVVRHLGNQIRLGTRHVDGAGEIGLELFSSSRRADSKTRAELAPFWVAADKGLGEDDQACAGRPRRAARSASFSNVRGVSNSTEPA